MLELVGHSAVEDGSENGDSENQQDLAPYPLAATLNEFLRVAGPNVLDRLESDAKRGARAAQGYPPEVSELLATSDFIQVLVEDTTSARRFQPPPPLPRKTAVSHGICCHTE